MIFFLNIKIYLIILIFYLNKNINLIFSYINYIFIPKIILYFHSYKKEWMIIYENIKINKNKKYDINNIGSDNKFIQVDSFYLYDNQSKVEVFKIKPDNQI